jgi:hypothetical protein
MPVGRILFIGSSRMDVGRPPAIRLARSRLRIVSPQDGNNFDHPSRQRNHDRTGEKASLQIKPLHPSHTDLTPTRPSMKPMVEDKRNSSVVCLGFRMPSGRECRPIFGFTALMTLLPRPFGATVFGSLTRGQVDPRTRVPQVQVAVSSGPKDRGTVVSASLTVLTYVTDKRHLLIPGLSWTAEISGSPIEGNRGREAQAS